MYWWIWSLAAIAFLGVLVVDAFAVLCFRYRRKRIITPNRAFIVGVCGSAIIMLYPLYLRDLGDIESISKYVKAALISVQHALRLFAFDGDYLEIVRMVEGLDAKIQTIYTLLGAILYLAAPILLVGLILSFFKNLSSHLRYMFSFAKSRHIFSELNEKSLALAKSIDDVYNKRGDEGNRKYKFWKGAVIVFTDVIETDDEDLIELIEEAREMGAILFSKDLESVCYRRCRFPSRSLHFYLISEDEEEKIRHAESIMQDYDKFDQTELFVFSNDIRSELLLATKNTERMKVIRINDIQSLVYHNLDTYGTRLFQNARAGDSDEKTISAVVVGLGQYGLEMMKALTWFCQVPGYRIKIHAFDIEENAEEKFENFCPELMAERLNKQNIPGEARYAIDIHGGMDVNSTKFFDALSQIGDMTYVFVCLGGDEVNLSAAIKIRAWCERVQKDSKPDIETVIYDSNLWESMSVKWTVTDQTPSPEGVVNFKKQSYDLHMIGDLDHFYGYHTLIKSDLVEEGRNVHLRYVESGDDSEFWKYEYNYRSSISKAMHERLRGKLDLSIPGVDKAWNERSEEEKLAIGRVEHLRWNAYMRSEGYQYSGSKERSTRNDLGKLHNNLVPLSELTDEELRKDG